MNLQTPEMGGVFNFSRTGAFLDNKGEISCRNMGELERGNLETPPRETSSQSLSASVKFVAQILRL